RQDEENAIIEQAYKKIDEEHDFSRDSVIVLAEDDWHSGVIGIVASRITEHYNLPSILISFDGDIGKGSGRSVHGLNLVDALKSCDDCLIKYGGHALAAGLSIERGRLDEFRRRINDFARDNLREDSLASTVAVDCTLQTSEINLQQASELYLLEPFGVSNPVPVFVLRDAVINDITPIGAGRHTKMTISKDGAFFTALCFGAVADSLDFLPGDIADFVFNLEINEFQNVQSVQLNVRDIAHGGAYLAQTEQARDIYAKAVRGEALTPEIYKSAVPQRDDFVGVYLYLKNESRAGRDSVTVHRTARAIGCAPLAGYVKVRLIFDIMNETGLINAVRTDDVLGERSDCVRYLFRINPVAAKINLDSSKLYSALKTAVAPKA
ncbi:MAG: DHHA1 domain-containing protein, partial [Eubacteriales bacterium]